MSATRFSEPRVSVRWAELDRLTLALVLSLALHGAIFGAYEGNRKYGWFSHLQLPAWLAKIQEKLVALQPKKNPPAAEREPPLMFVEVNSAAAIAEAPKNAKYYSSQNSRAANPNADMDSNVPKIAGTQEHVPKTEDMPRSKAFPLQPALPQNVEKPEPTKAPGDLAFAKPDLVPRNDESQTVHSKPRTIIEALARQQSNPLAGEKIKQAGGVKPKLEFSSLDVKATPFGAYDATIIAAVQNRWYDLLENRTFTGGKVSLEFHLHYDGRITDLRVTEKTTDELLCLLCQKAILDPAPYAAWPSAMRQMIGADYRELTFTFYYN